MCNKAISDWIHQQEAVEAGRIRGAKGRAIKGGDEEKESTTICQDNSFSQQVQEEDLPVGVKLGNIKLSQLLHLLH